MKRAKIIDIFSPEINDLFSFKPENPQDFCILLQICVGVSDDIGEQESGETFDIEVITPRWLLSNYDENEIILPKYTLIVFKFDFEEIFRRLKNMIESCSGETWEEIAKQIGNFAAWEFENYQSND